MATKSTKKKATAPAPDSNDSTTILNDVAKAFEESAAKNGICVKSSDEIIRERYGISPDQTNIPKLLYALLCEAVSK